jgi:hypothetical protein
MRGRVTGDVHNLCDLHGDGHRVSVVRHVPSDVVDVDRRMYAQATVVDAWASSLQIMRPKATGPRQ